MPRFAERAFAFATTLSTFDGGSDSAASSLDERRREITLNGVPEMKFAFPLGAAAAEPVRVDDALAVDDPSRTSGENRPFFFDGRPFGIGSAGWAKQLHPPHRAARRVNGRRSRMAGRRVCVRCGWGV